ncbi:MAG: VOC family protein [Gammaproteobacteria bacterium]
MTKFQGILHITWIVSNLERARRFYEGVLGLRPDESRPDLGFPGAWYVLESGQQIHIMELPNPDPANGRPVHGGRDRHVALAVDDVEVMALVLDGAGVPFTRSRSGRPALFVRDPDGNTFELVEVVNSISH